MCFETTIDRRQCLVQFVEGLHDPLVEILVKPATLLGNGDQLLDLPLQTLVAGPDLAQHNGVDRGRRRHCMLALELHRRHGIAGRGNHRDRRGTVDLADRRDVGDKGIATIANPVGNQVRSRLIGLQANDQFGALVNLDREPLGRIGRVPCPAIDPVRLDCVDISLNMGRTV